MQTEIWTRCTACGGERVDHLDDRVRAQLEEGRCPHCPHQGTLRTRIAGKPFEMPDVTGYCACCGSYWQTTPTGWTLSPGLRTVDHQGQLGKFDPEWYDASGSEFMTLGKPEA